MLLLFVTVIPDSTVRTLIAYSHDPMPTVSAESETASFYFIAKISNFNCFNIHIMASIRGKKLFLKDQLKAGIPDVRNSPSAGIGHLLENIKKELKQRGCNGFFGLQRRFKIMDDDGNKTLSMGEFKKALKELKLNLSEVDLRALFEHFDADGNESIDFEEFVQGIRDPLSERRLRLVYMAFKVIDKDGSGVVDAREIATMYDASKHPDVLAGRKKPMDVMKEFLETFDVGGVKDGMVTKQEFVNYYTNLGASIDNDDYFELMIRNAWHLSGGEGWCANSSNMRVLVTNSKGIERTIEIQNDLGLDKSDLPGIYRALKSQGEEDIQAINGKKLAISTINGRSSIEVAGETSKIEAVNFKLPQLSRELKVKSTHSPANSPFQAPTLIPLSPNKNNTNTNNSSKTLSPLKKMQEKMRQENAQMLVVSTLLDVLRVQLLSRGASGIIELQRRFVDMDADGSGALDYAEFQQALLGGQLAFSEDQLRALFGYFGKELLCGRVSLLFVYLILPTTISFHC